MMKLLWHILSMDGVRYAPRNRDKRLKISRLFFLILVDASLKYTHLFWFWRWCWYDIPDNIVELLLHDALKYIDKRKTTIVPNGFGKWWLGNLVTKLGGNREEYPCRGDITSYSLENETTLMIWQNTAWGEQEGVRRIIEEKLPSVKVYFQEEEPGNG